jgi:hypothetical protein
MNEGRVVSTQAREAVAGISGEAALALIDTVRPVIDLILDPVVSRTRGVPARSDSAGLYTRRASGAMGGGDEEGCVYHERTRPPSSYQIHTTPDALSLLPLREKEGPASAASGKMRGFSGGAVQVGTHRAFRTSP